MPILIAFRKSPKKGKKYVAVFANPKMTIHFGSDVSQTFAEGASTEKKENYIKRHKVREDWTKINAGSLSRYVLWSKPSVQQGLQEFMRIFRVKDNRRN
jgi:hypothetical protein